MMERFLTKELWDEAPKVTDEIIRWEDIPQQIIFCINYIEKLPTSNTWETYIIHYSDRAGVQSKVFCPTPLLKTIRKRRAPKQRPYFVAYGVDKNNGKKFANYELRFQETQTEFDIFEEGN